MDKYVFISYAHKDKKVVLNSIKALSSCGIRLWYDNGIEAGDDWANKIADKLANAAALILFLSKNSAKSKNVQREIEYAKSHGIPIITVQLYKFKLPEKFEKLLTVNQFTMLSSFKTYKSFAEDFCPVLEKYDVIGTDRPEYKDKKIRISGHRIFGKVLLALVVLIVSIIVVTKVFVANVPSVLGMETPPAENYITDAGFDCAVANGYSEEEDYGFIFEQNKYGSKFKNSTVLITQSLGPEVDLITVPNLVGFNISEGVSMLVEAGMKTFIISPVTTDEYAISYISAQSIAPNYKVSSQNKIVLSVSSTLDTVLEFYGKKIRMSDKKLEIQITDDNQVLVTPLMVFGITADFSQTNPVNEAGTIMADSHFVVSVKREDTQYFGTYRGLFETNINLSGKNSLAWRLLRAAYGDENGTVPITVKSEAFKCTAEEYDEEKYKKFVEECTGNSEDALEYTRPVMMILGKEIVLTDMSPLVRNIDWLYSIISNIVFSLPKLENDILIQPYSIIVQENGKVYVAFYGRDGAQRAMEFHGEISYE